EVGHGDPVHGARLQHPVHLAYEALPLFRRQMLEDVVAVGGVERRVREAERLPAQIHMKDPLEGALRTSHEADVGPLPQSLTLLTMVLRAVAPKIQIGEALGCARDFHRASTVIWTMCMKRRAKSRA